MNIDDINDSFGRLDSAYIKYVDNIKNISDVSLNKEIPSAYILYLKSRWYFLKGNIEKADLFYRLNHILHSSSIPYQAIIGKNSVFAYGGIGCIIHNATKIGARCVIGSNVTIGGAKNGIPCIGDDVYISTGAKILGGVEIGDGAIIGANAVVNRDVLPFTVVAGSPAKTIGEVTISNFDKYSGFYWCKNNDDSSKKFCEWYKARGRLKE